MNSALDSSQMDSSSQDNATNSDLNVNTIGRGRSNNRVIIPGINSGSMDDRDESGDQENYGDRHLREGNLINNKSPGMTESSKLSSSSTSRSSDRHLRDDLDPDLQMDIRVTEVGESPRHRTNGTHDVSSDNSNTTTTTTTVPSTVDAAIVSEKDNSGNPTLKDNIRSVASTRTDVQSRSGHSGDADRFHQPNGNTPRGGNVNGDHVGHPSFDFEASRCQGDARVMATPPEKSSSSSSSSSCNPYSDRSLHFPASPNPHSHAATNLPSRKPAPREASLSSSSDVAAWLAKEDSGPTSYASLKRDSRRSSAGQGQSEAANRKSTTNGPPTGVCRSLPVHCVIEQTPSEADDTSWSSDDYRVVNDSYAILPGNTLFSEIVWTSLTRLGYSSQEATGATGGIQLKNWQTLDFDVITENPEATVEEMLGEIMSVATLRIRLACEVNEDLQEAVKEKLSQLLYSHSKDFLLSVGCPMEKTLLDAVSQGKLSQTISEPLCTAFNMWFSQRMGQTSPHGKSSTGSDSSLQKHQKSSSAGVEESEKADASEHQKPLSSMPTASMPLKTPPLKSSLFCTSASSTKSNKQSELAPMNNPHYLNQPIKFERMNPKLESPMSPQGHQDNHYSHQQTKCDMAGPLGQKVFSEHPLERLDHKSSLPAGCDPSLAMNYPPHSHPSAPYMGVMPGKTRIRTSFDPEHEIPRLQKWFGDNQHPTREQMMRFMSELNTLESRKGRRPLDLTNIIYWFKNARAAQRRASKAMDDSFENEENLDVSNSGSGGSTGGETVPPYLPNKNAVYMIPFHPYPQIMSRAGNSCSSENGNTGAGSATGNGCDEPYDLSLTKRSSSESGKSSSGNEAGSGESCSDHVNYYNSPQSPKMSPESAEDLDLSGNREMMMKRKLSSGQCPPPRFPALLDVVSKMRREIPPTSEDVYNNNSNTANSLSSNNNTMDNDNNQTSSSRPGSRCSEVDHVYKTEDHEQSYPKQNLHHRDNGYMMSPHHMQALKMSCEDNRYDTDAVLPKKKKHFEFDRGSDMELGQINNINKEAPPMPPSNGNINCSDEDNSNDSYDSEEELKMRMKQSAAAVADYASAMHSNVSRLTAANMAALSLAQMGQPLHIPQLPPSLAMAYYPMDPRFYSQPQVSSSLPSSSSPTPTSSHLAPHPGQATPNSLLDSPSPLPSPSSMQHSMGQHGHHHQRHQHQQQQQQSSRHHSETRKRRTRVFIDPLSEIPKLEKWFTEDTHPSAFMIDKYCEELNKCEYRQKFPKLEPKNVQLWFKNHRAKVKRLKVSFDGKYEEMDDYVGDVRVDDEEDMKREGFEMRSVKQED